MSESHSFVTHEELEVCFVKYDMIKTLEKKEDEKKLLEIFSRQNEKISIMNDTSRPSCNYSFITVDNLSIFLFSFQEQFESEYSWRGI